ncbi:lipoprotein [Litchfieldia salsa]
MKKKIMLLLVLIVLVLAGCGQKQIEESITLLDQNNNEVSFPQDKPTLFFFITTYT